MPIFRDFKPKGQAVAELWGRYSKWAPRDPKHTPWRLLKRTLHLSYLEKKSGARGAQKLLKMAISDPKTHYFALYRGLWVPFWANCFSKVFQRTLGSHSEPTCSIYLDFTKKIEKSCSKVKNAPMKPLTETATPRSYRAVCHTLCATSLLVLSTTHTNYPIG